MSKRNFQPADFCNPLNTEKVLRENNCEIKNCSGSHRKSPLPDGTVLVYPGHHTGIGLASKIFKIFKNLGFLVFFGVIGFGIFSAGIWILIRLNIL